MNEEIEENEELQCYLVGGAVRDGLLGRAPGDRDWVVVGSTPSQMQSLGYTQVGRDFPVYLHPDTHEEYALARTERKQGDGHRGFLVNADPSVTLEDDLLRRDLTVNAIAQNPEGSLVDPFGGVADIEQRMLRHVSAAFAEDPLRVFRVARFAAQLPEFTVAPQTLVLMRTMAARGDLQLLSAERVWQETAKALGAINPQRFFEVLSEADAMSDWFPEIVLSDLSFMTPVHCESVQGEASHLEADKVRFAQLPLAKEAFQTLATRLKTPSLYLQCALDRVTWAEVVSAWQTVPVAMLGAAFDALKVAHEQVRLEWLVAWLGGHNENEFAGLLELARTYKNVPMPPGEFSGAAYGEALQQARLLWLDEQR